MTAQTDRAAELTRLAAATTTTTIHTIPVTILIRVATRPGSCGKLADALTAYLTDNTIPDTPCGRALTTGDLSHLTTAQQRILRTKTITPHATD